MITKYEQETIINYNQDELTANIYTCDKVLIRKLDKMIEVSKVIILKTQDEDSKTYICPKKWIKVRMPRVLSDEEREKMASRARERFGITSKQV